MTNASSSASGAATKNPLEFTLSREFDVTPDVMYQAFTDRDQLMQWFGPIGTKISKAELTPQAGGKFHYCLELPNGDEMWGMWLIQEWAPTELRYILHFSDAAGGITRHPMAPTWPAELQCVMTIKPKGNGTELGLSAIPIKASEEEEKLFRESHDNLKQGWGGTFKQLEDFFASKKK